LHLSAFDLGTGDGILAMYRALNGSEEPGMRLLVIVGSSHKGYLDAYLDQMHDVRIADVAPVLR
jgi:hypothetical protein